MACEKRPIGEPDAAPHSAVPVVAPLAFYLASSTKGLNLTLEAEAAGAPSGWVVCSPTRSSPPGVRPLFWPLPERRFGASVSCWYRDYHARPIALVEHAALLGATAWLLSRDSGNSQRLGTALIRFRVRCFEEGWIQAKKEVL